MFAGNVKGLKHENSFSLYELTRLERMTLGLGYVASYVQGRGHECELVDYTWGGENVLDKISDLKRRFAFSRINFVDDVFTIDIRWLREFAPRYKKYGS